MDNVDSFYNEIGGLRYWFRLGREVEKSEIDELKYSDNEVGY
jgi:hypothetical protein